MFGKSILIFVFLLICLGVGTIALIESETGADILPERHEYITSAKVRDFYLTHKTRLLYWWSKISGKDTEHYSSIRYEKIDPKQPKIMKWQDQDGHWHFEYEKSVPPTEK